MNRFGAWTGALLVVLLWTQLGQAGEVVWCHQVGRGETLTAIARRYGVAINELRGLNRLGAKATLRPRRILTLPTVHALRDGRLDLARPPLVATARRLRAENAAALATGFHACATWQW